VTGDTKEKMKFEVRRSRKRGARFAVKGKKRQSMGLYLGHWNLGLGIWN
jgi:hypothetical protein